MTTSSTKFISSTKFSSTTTSTKFSTTISKVNLDLQSAKNTVFLAKKKSWNLKVLAFDK